MGKVIIGIHGLANKPAEGTLRAWWEKSIKEGLNNLSAAAPPTFEMVYWADRLYRYPQHNDVGFETDVLYNHQPYVAASPGSLQTYHDGMVDEARRVGGLVLGGGLDAMRRLFKPEEWLPFVLDKVVRDLALYYAEDGTVKTLLRQILRDALLSHRDDEIMLISHSMGSIIAYDVLRDLGQSNPDFKIKHFVTIGSPLGLPLVKGKIMEERPYDPKARTPSVVGNWVNFSDKRDKVALDPHLKDDYRANGDGVAVRDDLVKNDYTSPSGDANFHKSYGYLRTPEMSNLIVGF